jgi:hypothetical protein
MRLIFGAKIAKYHEKFITLSKIMKPEFYKLSKILISNKKTSIEEPNQLV